MGILAAIGVLIPFPYYYWLWTNPESWVNLCGNGRDPSKVMAIVSHFFKLLQFISLFSVSTLSWPPPFYFWPLFLFGQFLNFRIKKKMGILAAIGVLIPFPYYYWLWTNPESWVNLCGNGRDPSKVMAIVSHFFKLLQFISLFSVSTLSWPPPFYFWPLFLFGQFLNFRIKKKMGILAAIGVLIPFPYYYWLWTNPESWVNLCGNGRDPSKVMAIVSHFFKLLQFISLFSVSTLSWPPPFYFWPLFLFGQFLNFRIKKKMGILAAIGVLIPFPYYYWLWTNPESWVNLCGNGRDPSKVMAIVSHFFKLLQFISLFSVSTLSWPPPFYFWPLFLFGQFLNFRVYQLLGESGTYYGVRFGKDVPWVTGFPFGVIKDPQYIGSIMSLLACLSWVPFQYILLWTLGYVFMIQLESKEDPSTRAKPRS